MLRGKLLPWNVSLTACARIGVDIRQGGLPAVLRDDGTQLVRVGVHGDRAQRRPLRRRLSRRLVDVLPNSDAGRVRLGRRLAAVARRRHSRLPLRRHGLSLQSPMVVYQVVGYCVTRVCASCGFL